MKHFNSIGVQYRVFKSLIKPQHAAEHDDDPMNIVFSNL